MAAKGHTPHLRVRIEPSLLARLEKSRAKSGRTLTGEIVQRLEHSFHKDDTQQFIEQLGQSLRESILAGLVSPDVPRWAAEEHRADELERLAEKTKDKEEKNRLLTEARAIRANVQKAMSDDSENARKRWKRRREEE